MKHLIYTQNAPSALLARVRESKARVLPDELVQPHKAVPGSPGRILAYAEPPDWACEYALVNDATSDEGLDAALSHCLGLIDHPKGVTTAQWLSRVLGGKVTELEDEPDYREGPRFREA